jgi:hypothetical protein
MTYPRGIRNNNPGNIIKSEAGWQGKIEGEDSRFETFDTPHNGLRALAKQLVIYQDKYDLKSIREIINRWAPSIENDTESYESRVSTEIGVGVDYPLDLHNDLMLSKLVTAIVRHENGQQPYTDDQIRAAVQDALGYSYTQPAAPIEERPQPNQPETPMPESPSFDWSMLAKAGGAIASIFNPAIGLAITALSPLLQEKITKTVAKHTDDPKVAAEIGKSLSDAVMETTKLVTGKSDDLEAVAVMRKDPALVAKVEQAVTSKLAELAPYLDKVTELEARERADTLTAQDAAAARAKGEAWDMTPWLVGFMGGMVLLVVGFFGAVAIMDMVKNGKVATEVWAALTGVSGTLLGILGTIYAYRFASTAQSAAKNAIISEIARSKT